MDSLELEINHTLAVTLGSLGLVLLVLAPLPTMRMTDLVMERLRQQTLRLDTAPMIHCLDSMVQQISRILAAILALQAPEL